MKKEVAATTELCEVTWAGLGAPFALGKGKIPIRKTAFPCPGWGIVVWKEKVQGAEAQRSELV